MANYDFFPQIPATNNNPSTDQPSMQTNFQSINDWSAVDHVGYETDDGGTHKQVSFSSNNVPGASSFPTAFVDTVGALPQLKFYSTNQANSGQYVNNATSGSTMLLGGMILKWGSFTLTSGNTSVNVSFASSGFTNSAYAVNVTGTNSTAAGRTIYVSALSQTQFTLSISNTNPANSTFYYIAIGY